ncbi:Uncharacterised protein [Mycobacteroides abscessus subsp. abscessus]|nr:Uncharacterised protein [Mycobacteroides abscessus subsp. abscessus]
MARCQIRSLNWLLDGLKPAQELIGIGDVDRYPPHPERLEGPAYVGIAGVFDGDRTLSPLESECEKCQGFGSSGADHNLRRLAWQSAGGP